MGPRMREDNGGGDGFPSPSSWGQALRGNNGRERGFHCGMTGIRGRAVREPPLREKERVHGERFLDFVGFARNDI